MNRRTIAIAVGMIALLGGTAAADILLLTDGRVFEGRPMERVAEGVKIKFENGEILVRTDLIQDAVLENDAGMEPKTDEERENTAKGLVRFEGRWVTKARRADLVQRKIAARRKEIKEVRSHEEWRNRLTEKTKHFVIEYTVSPHIHAYYRDKMEAYFKAFQKTWKIKVPRHPGVPGGRLRICFYSDRAKFAQIGGLGGGVLAYFKFSVPWELNFFYDRLDAKLTEEVLFHEMNHYLQQLLDVKFSMPHFPGEALAEYYGASYWDPVKKKLTVGLVKEGRLAGIQIQIKNGDMLALDKMLRTSRMGEHYSWGWTLVHYCMTNPKYAGKFQKFVKSLVTGRGVKRVPQGGVRGLMTVKGPEVWRVFQKVMGLRNKAAVKKFESAWHRYVQTELKLETGSGLTKAALAAIRDGRKIRAKRLFQEAIDAGAKSAITYHRYAELMDQDGKRDKAITLWRRAIELDPLESTFYVSIGRALSREGKGDEAKKLLGLAKELDPDDRSIDRALKNLD